MYDSNNNFNPTIGIQYFYGKIASEQAKMILNNQIVELEEIKKDIYNRIIAKVTLHNGLDFASYMIENGYARLAYISDNKYNPFYFYDINYVHKLQELEKDAQRNKKGFWKETTENINKIFYKK